MKIYAVTAGIYSSYHIVTLTTDETKANAIAKIYQGYVEEYEDGEERDFRVPFRYYGLNNVIVPLEYERNIEEKVIPFTRGDKESYDVLIYAKDREHARKKAQDMIAQYKAQQEGI